MKSIRISRAGPVFAVLAFLAAAPSFATEYTFSFSGAEVSPNNSSFTATLTGTGTFTTDMSPVFNALNASDLASFSLTTVFSPGHGPGTAYWDFGLGDLTSFTFETTGGTFPPPLLELTTDSLNGVASYIYPGQITIAGLEPNQVSLFINRGTMPYATATISSVTASPEPSTFLLIGCLGLPAAVGIHRLTPRWPFC